MKYEIFLLNRSTRFSLWHVKMQSVLALMDMDDALLELDKMSSSWIEEDRRNNVRIVKPYLIFTFIYRIRFCKTF